MKNKLMNVLVVLILAGLVFACGAKKEAEQSDTTADAASDEKEWKQMDEFHMVMAETFHPFKDSANLEPAKSQAGALATSAETWAAAPLPKKVDNDEMKTKLEALKAETASLVQLAASGDDKQIGEQLTKVHDQFHEIQEMWYGGEKHEHH